MEARPILHQELSHLSTGVSSGKFIIDTGSIIESPRAAGMSVKYPQGISCITIAAPEE